MPQQYAGFTPDETPDLSGFTPDPVTTEEGPDYLGAWDKLWFNQPLINKIKSRGVQIYDPAYAANYYDNPAARTEDQATIPDWVPYVGGGTYRSLGAGLLEGAGNVVAGLTSPLNLATLGTAKYATGAAKTAQGLEEVGKSIAAANALKRAQQATTATRALSAPLAVSGAARAAKAYEAGDIPGTAFGVAEMAGGLGGAFMPSPRIKPKGAGALENLPIKENEPYAASADLSVNEPANIEPPMPVRPPVTETPGLVGRSSASIKGQLDSGKTPIFGTPDDPYMERGGLPPEFSPDRPIVNEPIPETGGTAPRFTQSLAQTEGRTLGEQKALMDTAQPASFDPNSLVGLKRAEPVQFVDPNTGAVKSAEQAVPGDVPILPEKQPTAQPQAPTPEPARPLPTLPRELAGAKPRWWTGDRSHTPIFEDDLDKALWIIANPTRRSRADGLYLKWVMDNTGMTEAEARAAGVEIKKYIKEHLVQNPDVEEVRVPSLAREKGLVSEAGVVNRPGVQKIGAVSSQPKTLTDWIKTLATEESGEFDIEAIKKVGRKIGEFINKKETPESAQDDFTRIQELWEKQKAGTLTPDELAEARQLAQRPEVSAQGVTQSLSQRLKSASKPGLLDKSQLEPDIPIQARKMGKAKEQTPFNEVWNLSRSLQSIDLPGVTSAALRQSRPLAFTADWFKAWGKAYQAFGSKTALDAINAKIENSKYFRPRYEPVINKSGEIIKYVEKPSIAEELGVKMTDIANFREEAIASSLAEKIPGYGRYVKASNRAYTGFLNDLRANKFEQLMDGAKALGRNPELDMVLGKQIADFVNNATGRGALRYHNPITGREFANLEPVASALGDVLYSPRALSARLSFMNPYNYIKADPIVRAEYWKGMSRIAVSWGAFAGLASLMPNVKVSLDPNNADFGKIRIGNTRIDPGAGWQQLMVLFHRELPMFGKSESRSELTRLVSGGGGTVSSIGKPGHLGKFTEFGKTPMSSTRLSLPGRYFYNQLNPMLRFVFDMIGASRKEPFDLTDRTLQLVLPMYLTDIADAAKDDNITAAVFAPILSSTGAGVQTYEKGDFGKPQITPLINPLFKSMTGSEIPTTTIGAKSHKF